MKNNLLKKHAKSFYWASFFLSRNILNKCSSLYNFCRTLDDIVDDNSNLSIRKEIFSKFKKDFALKKLKQSNYKLAILSNGTPDLLNELVVSNQLKDIFDDIFSVEEAGIFKPDSKVYDLPINKYNIEKNEVLFLSANTWDVSGAGNYGYNTVWVNRNNNIFEINPLEITSSSGHIFVYPPIDPDLGKIVILSTDSIPFLTADTIALPTSL